LDIKNLEVRGEKVEDVASFHEYAFPYTEDGTLPLPLARKGIEGLSYPKYDDTLCTFCSFLGDVVLPAIVKAYPGRPLNEIEILTGKIMDPSPGKNATILMGKCIYQAKRDHPNIKNLIAVKGCPPSHKKIYEALGEAGIDTDPDAFEDYESRIGKFMRRYADKPEFDESFYRVD
jgi:hypothetical protein